MPFVSDIGDTFVIDDQTVINSSENRGLIPRDYSRQPVGFAGYAAPFSMPLIPREEWKERIEERERKGLTTRQFCESVGLNPLNQSRTNYCWANGPTHCVEIVFARQNGSVVRLSPASIAAPIKGYRNQGGWGAQALEYGVEHGWAPQKMWPANAIDRRYDTPESRAARKHYQADEWWDFQPRNFDQLITALLNDFPCSTAHNWMSHVVTPLDPIVMRNGEIGIYCANSGYGRDATGHMVLTGNRAVPDETICPRVVTAA